MKTIVNDKRITFKEFEQNIFRFVCEAGQEMTRIILESYDEELAKERDTRVYRDKGKRSTSIKTVYGEVTYKRRVYQKVGEDGKRVCVFLLDEEIGMDKIGLISTNLAEKIALAATEAPYRKGAEFISSTSGETISHMGVWNVIQRLGERICQEESFEVQKMEAGESRGTRATPILFEEMDGVWLRMQDEHHKKMPGKEMKVFTMYEGWDSKKEEEGRSTLAGRKVLAGMEESREFHQKREACIEQTYDPDEIGQRILNGDGGSWIKETYDPEVIFQLDPYHVQAAILKGLGDQKAVKEVRDLLEEGKIEELLEYIQIYADSVESDDAENKKSRNARKLYTYLSNNRDGLIPWQKQMEMIPAPPEGKIYKNMGVQENQNCTVITLRMKHRRMRWSVNGANNIGKALYRKANGELQETIARYTDGLISSVSMEEILEPLSAAKAPKKDGKGDVYPEKISHHMPLVDAMQTAARKAFRKALLGGEL